MKTFIIVTLAVVIGIILAASIGYTALVAYPAWRFEREAPARAALVKACEAHINNVMLENFKSGVVPLAVEFG